MRVGRVPVPIRSSRVISAKRTSWTAEEALRFRRRVGAVAVPPDPTRVDWSAGMVAQYPDVPRRPVDVPDLIPSLVLEVAEDPEQPLAYHPPRRSDLIRWPGDRRGGLPECERPHPDTPWPQLNTIARRPRRSARVRKIGSTIRTTVLHSISGHFSGVSGNGSTRAVGTTSLSSTSTTRWRATPTDVFDALPLFAPAREPGERQARSERHGTERLGPSVVPRADR